MPEDPQNTPEETPEQDIPEGSKDDKGLPPDDDDFFGGEFESEGDLDDQDVQSAKDAVAAEPEADLDTPEPDSELISDDEAAEDDDDAGEPDDSGEPEFDDRLVAEARSLGLDPEGFMDERALRHTVSLMRAGRSTEAPPTTQDPTEADREAVAALQYQLELSEELDPEVSKALQGMNEHYATQAYRDSQRIQQLEQLAQQVEASAFLQRVDGYIKELGDAWGPVFGEQSVTQMDRESTEFKNFVRTLETLDAMRRTQAERGQDVDEKSAFETAVYATFPKHVKSLALNEVRGQLKGRKTISRPSHRKRRNGAASETEDAASFVQEFARQRGLLVDDAENDGF